MYKIPTIILGAFVLLIVGGMARAATPLEFTFSGVYTQVAPGSAHSVGEPFESIVVFDPATPDLNSDPIRGQYRFISWTAPSPTSMPFVFENEPPSIASITILNGGVTDQWRISFLGGTPFLWEIVINFPNNEFATDALPLTLDLSRDTFAEFTGATTVLQLRGDITALSVRQVPEPIAAIAAIFCTASFLSQRFSRTKCFASAAK